MKVAVTGASGHIGNCLVRELINQGAQVKVLVHNFRNHLAELDIELIQGNLLEPESLNRLCKGVDVVFHLAAQIAIDNRSLKLVYETNVTGTKNIIKASIDERVKKFIHFSSIDAFLMSHSNRVLDENSPIVEKEKGVYEFTKAESERVVMNAIKEGLNAIIVSPTAVIGPFDYRGSYLGQVLIKIYKHKLPFLISAGYNWVDVRDVVAASIKSIELGRRGEKYILSGNFCSLKELSIIIGKLSGNKSPKLVPVYLARFAAPFFQSYAVLTKNKPLYTNHSLDILEKAPKNISSEKAQKELNYSPRPLEQTLSDTFDWYKRNSF